MRSDHNARWLASVFRDLPRHTPATFLIRVGAVGIEFGCMLVLARILSTETYGSYAIAMTWVAIMAVPATVGFDRLAVRETAMLRAVGDWAHAAGFLRRSLQIVLATSVLAGAATFAAAHAVLAPASMDAARALALAAALVPIVALARLRQALQQGLGHVASGLAPEYILQPLIVIALAVAFVRAAPVTLTAGTAMVLQLVAAGLALVLGIWFLRRQLPPPLRQAIPRFRTGAWWRAGITFMWLVTMTTVLTNIDTILVGRIAGDAQAGVYRVASQLAMLVGLPLTAVSMAMAPVIASLYAEGRTDELRVRCRAAARVAVAAAILLAAAIGIGGHRILAAFGPEFAQGYRATLLLSVAYVIHSAMATSGYLLIMSAHERLVVLVFMAGAAANVAGCLALIPAFGMSGAALASGISLGLVSVTCAVLARRKLGINGSAFARSPEPGSAA